MREEVKIMQAIHHPNVVCLEQALFSDRNCYLVTEFCEGGNLTDCLNKHKKVS